LNLSPSTLLKVPKRWRTGSGPPTFDPRSTDAYYDTTDNYLYLPNGTDWYRVQLSLYTPAAGVPGGWLYNDADNSSHMMLTFD